jgi:surface polysaccharide O-acyltransferase-like enzyme
VGESAKEAVRRDRRVELLAAIMVSIATVVTAWSAYQATRWSGDQAESYTFLLSLGAVMLAIGTIIVIMLPQNVGF